MKPPGRPSSVVDFHTGRVLLGRRALRDHPADAALAPTTLRGGRLRPGAAAPGARHGAAPRVRRATGEALGVAST